MMLRCITVLQNWELHMYTLMVIQISRSPEKIYGFELSAKYRLHSKVDIGANYSFTEGKRELTDKKVYLGGDRINPQKLLLTVIRPLEAWSIYLQMINTEEIVLNL
jgi:iron complex outermembrane receptor protein